MIDTQIGKICQRALMIRFVLLDRGKVVVVGEVVRLGKVYGRMRRMVGRMKPMMMDGVIDLTSDLRTLMSVDRRLLWAVAVEVEVEIEVGLVEMRSRR